MYARGLSQLKKRQGQSLTEYSLVIGLVALASIASIATLGGNISVEMTQSLGGRNNNPQLTQDMQQVNRNLGDPTLNSETTNSGFLGGVQNGSPTAHSASENTNTSILCPAGLCARFPVISQQNELVDVAAGEGAEFIHQFANTFEEIAASLEADPNHDPQLAALIRGLATNGHVLGDKQALVLQIGPNQTIQDFEPSRTIIEYSTSQTNFETQWQHIQDYFNQKPNQASGGLADILSSQKNQIMLLSGSVVTREIGQQHVIETNDNTKLIHQSANTICGQQSQQDCIRNHSDDSASAQ